MAFLPVFDIDSGLPVAATLASLPDALDGLDGELRETNEQLRQMLRADTDLEAISRWLKEAEEGSLHTRRAYVKEIERLLMWSWYVKGLPLSSLYRADYLEYQDFIRNLPSEWVGPKCRRFLKDGTRNPNWRPFVASLTDKSAAQSMIIIRSLLNFLTEHCYLVANPLAGKSKAFASAAKDDGRRDHFLESEWALILETADELPSPIPDDERADAIARANAARDRWLVRLMHGTAMRISEVSTHSFAAFREEEDAQRNRHWSIYVRGKGDKPAKIPVSSALLKEMQRYRASLGLSTLPVRNEQTPLVCNVNSTVSLTQKELEAGARRDLKPVSDRRLAQIFKSIVERAAKKIETSDPSRAAKLKSAWPHMVRHTAITEVARTADVKTTQLFARHSKVDTTMLYVHKEDEELRRAVEDSGI